ncbi:putative gustatory receptor 2a [Anopheles aquasalis]|uniref:putative gustatory receptor 2a n=1 Tax=Anopheles aquasalis TaxID=42839 RepID=UPI00215AB90F|nr:putative gustatory receptor 2a [Anopheles aquasalis]
MMLLLLLGSVSYNLVFCYIAGVIPFGYNFRSGRFVQGPTSRLVAIGASLLLLLWISLQLGYRKQSNRMAIPKVGMQDVIHAIERLVLNGNCLLIGVLQLLHRDQYRRLLMELLTGVRSWQLASHRTAIAIFTKLVLLPGTIYGLHLLVYAFLVSFELSIVEVVLSMVSLIPNMVHVNNFYVLMSLHRSTLREINGKLANLWTVCNHPTGSSDDQHHRALVSETEPVSIRLHRQLLAYQECAAGLYRLLRFYDLPVAMYLLILIGEVITKIFFQFTYFYGLVHGPASPLVLDLLGAAMLVVFAIEISLLVGVCQGISQESHNIKSSVHRLSLVAGQDAHFRYTVKSFLLWLNHARLEVSIAGMFTLDCEMLFGMVSTIATFVVLLTQFHIAYSGTGRTEPNSSTNISLLARAA